LSPTRPVRRQRVERDQSRGALRPLPDVSPWLFRPFMDRVPRVMKVAMRKDLSLFSSVGRWPYLFGQTRPPRYHRPRCDNPPRWRSRERFRLAGHCHRTNECGSRRVGRPRWFRYFNRRRITGLRGVIGAAIALSLVQMSGTARCRRVGFALSDRCRALPPPAEPPQAVPQPGSPICPSALVGHRVPC